MADPYSSSCSSSSSCCVCLQAGEMRAASLREVIHARGNRPVAPSRCCLSTTNQQQSRPHAAASCNKLKFREGAWNELFGCKCKSWQVFEALVSLQHKQVSILDGGTDSGREGNLQQFLLCVQKCVCVCARGRGEQQIQMQHQERKEAERWDSDEQSYEPHQEALHVTLFCNT